MISPAKQRRIFTLAAGGNLTSREIAERVGCCKETVRQALRRGTIQLNAKTARKKWQPYRCRGCGYRITLRPCVICQARKGQDHEQRQLP